MTLSFLKLFLVYCELLQLGSSAYFLHFALADCERESLFYSMRVYYSSSYLHEIVLHIVVFLYESDSQNIFLGYSFSACFTKVNKIVRSHIVVSSCKFHQGVELLIPRVATWSLYFSQMWNPIQTVLTVYIRY